jgi:hypothetical protein
MTPSLLIAASNLTSNIGLQPNAAMVSAMTAVNSNSLVSNYAILQPGTAYGNTLSARGWTVTNLKLPTYIANANTTISTVSVHYNKMLPSIGSGLYDITKFASVLAQAGAFASSSLTARSSLESFYSQSFDNLGISVTNHSSAVANGISNIFGSAAQIKTLSSAIRRFGTAYDATRLNKLGDPATFIQNLLNHGFGENGKNGVYVIGGYMLPMTWKTDDADTLMAYLKNISGTTLDKIISQTNLNPASTISNLSQLLDLSMIFNSTELAVVPGNNFAGLANEFVNLGGKFNSFTEVADMLANIEIPTLTYLDSYTKIISNTDYANLVAKLGTGTGTIGNPTITDLLGSVAGVVHNNSLTTVKGCLTTALANNSGLSVNTNLANVVTQCATGTSSQIDNAFLALWSAANTFVADTTLSSTTLNGNLAIYNMQSQVTKELTNLALAGVSLSDATPSGVTGVLGLVNNLHDYGIDGQSLNYGTLLEGCRQDNAGGDAVHAALVEGRNLANQAKNSVLIGTRYTG